MKQGVIRFILQNAKGFSLTEIMVGGAVLAGVALASAQLFKDQKISQKKIEYDQQLALYHSNLVKVLTQTGNCNATMRQLIPQGSGLTAPLTVNTLFICVPSGTNKCLDDNSTADRSFDAYTPGAYAGTALISTNQYTDNTLSWQVTRMQLLDSRTTTGTTRLRMTYRMNTKIPGFKTVNKDIFLNLRFFNNAFRECVNNQESSVNNLQNDFCKTINLSEGTATSDGRMAIWDEATQTCRIVGTKDCTWQYNMHTDGIGADGVVRCKTLIHNTDAQAIQDTGAGVTCPTGTRPQVYYDGLLKQMKVRCVP